MEKWLYGKPVQSLFLVCTPALYGVESAGDFVDDATLRSLRFFGVMGKVNNTDRFLFKF
jgi:hypothetical protein